MEFIAGFFLLFILILYIATHIINNRRINNESLQEEQEQLLSQIEQMTVKLTEQRKQYQHNKLDKSVNLSNVVNNTLDLYEQSNIRIPSDIIEQLGYTTFYNEKEVYDFIENQRSFWKLENTKKPYIRK